MSHRADFLEIRRRHIRELVEKGETFNDIACALSLEVGQVHLISMTETALPCRVTDALDAESIGPRCSFGHPCQFQSSDGAEGTK